MCDGEAAEDCEIINYAEYESLVNDQTVKLNEKFSILAHEMDVKKEACVETCRKDPRISFDDTLNNFFSQVQKIIQDLNLIQKESEKEGLLFGPQDHSTISDKDAVICQSFSENNYHVVLSNENRSVKSERFNENHRGYCFLEHPKLSNMDILIWTLKISKFKIGDVGKVMLYKL